MADLRESVRQYGKDRLRTAGYLTCFGRHVDARHFHTAGTVDERLADIENAIDDPSVEIVMPAYGGYNSNQLLPLLDYRRIGESGKTFVGFSDVTALLLAIGSRSGTPVVHGPSFAVLCDPDLSDYTWEHLQQILRGESVVYRSPAQCADDPWYLSVVPGKRDWYPAQGWWVHRSGVARAPLAGGNLETLCALAGTPFFPSLDGHLLFVEDATGSSPGAFHRDLTHLQQLGVFSRTSGLIVGAMPRGTSIGRDALAGILADVLRDAPTAYPVVCNVNCSHVDPIMSLPLFRDAVLTAGDDVTLEVTARAV